MQGQGEHYDKSHPYILHLSSVQEELLHSSPDQLTHTIPDTLNHKHTLSLMNTHTHIHRHTCTHTHTRTHTHKHTNWHSAITGTPHQMQGQGEHYDKSYPYILHLSWVQEELLHSSPGQHVPTHKNTHTHTHTHTLTRIYRMSLMYCRSALYSQGLVGENIKKSLKYLQM